VADPGPLGRVVGAALARLPARDRERLAALARLPGGARPDGLRSALAQAGGSTDDLAASLTLLAAAGLVEVRDDGGAAHVRVPDSLAALVVRGRGGARVR
jgi:hypothetical protein